MDIDESIAQLSSELDALLDANLATFASKDRAEQGKILLRGIEIVTGLERLKAKGLATLKALLNRQDTTADDERARSLVRGFELGAKLAHALHDELLDTNGETKVMRRLDAIFSWHWMRPAPAKLPWRGHSTTRTSGCAFWRGLI